MSILPYLNIFSTLAYINLAAFILAKNPRSALNRICAAIMGCFVLWCLGKSFAHNPMASEVTAHIFLRVEILGAWSFSAFLLWFALIFTEKRELLDKTWFYPALFAIPVTTITVQLLDGAILTHVKHSCGWDLAWKPSFFTYLLLGYVFVFILAAVVLIFHHSIRVTDPVKKKQARIIGMSTFLGFVVVYATDIGFNRLSAVEVPILAQNMALIWALGLVYMIIKYQFLTISPATAAQNIIATMADALILANPQGRIVTANVAALALLGYGENELIGRHLGTIVYEREKHLPKLLNAMRPGVIQNRDFILRRKNGVAIPVNLSTSTLKSEGSGTIAGAVIIARDISERMQAQKELMLAKKKAEKANRTKSEFLANMSHELRTPLNHIIGFSELIRDERVGPINAAQKEYLGDVCTSSKHLLSLINDILDLSKVEAGRLELTPCPVDLHQLMENSLMMVKEKAMKHSIQLNLDIEGIRNPIEADERKLRQIMYNLLSNALKFTPDGGKVSITVRPCVLNRPRQSDREPQPNDGICITVSDNGIGIAQKNLERIFEPFEQVQSSLSRQYQGTGLGLSLTRKLVNLHGGRLLAESGGEGKGSTFRLIIPAEKRPAQKPPEAGPDVKPAALPPDRRPSVSKPITS